MERREVGQLGGGMRLVDDAGAPILLRGAGGIVQQGGGRSVGSCLGNHRPPAKDIVGSKVGLGGG